MQTCARTSCGQWRCMPAQCAVIDLADAYMQLRAHSSCSKYQMVQFEGKTYELTRVGFGLACAPQILQAVIKYVINLDPFIASACNAYYDDVIVDLTKVSARWVRDHFRQFGLIAKEAKPLAGNSALGLAIREGAEGLEWSRPLKLDLNLTRETTKREWFFDLRPPDEPFSGLRDGCGLRRATRSGYAMTTRGIDP